MSYSQISRHLVLMFLTGLHFLIAAEVFAQTNTVYILNSEDVVRVRVGNWSDAKNSYEEWAGISGNYKVSNNGEISFPLLGNVPAAGHTTTELMNTIQLELQVNIGLSSPPAVSIEIATYNPIYVTGDVYNPGPYEFSPGMTVQRAIALAGGYGRGIDMNTQSERYLLEVAGQRRGLELSKIRLEILISRLENTLKNDGTFEPSTGISAPLGAVEYVRIEREIFFTQRDATNAKIASVNTLIELLENVIIQLSGRLGILTEDIERTSENLENKRGLVQLGLARVDEENVIASSLSALQMREVDLTVELLNSKQRLNAAIRESESILPDQNLRTLQQLEDAHAKLSDLEASIAVQSEVYSAALASQAALAQVNTVNPWIISILGKGGQINRENAISESTVLRPGDTISIRIREMSDGTQ